MKNLKTYKAWVRKQGTNDQFVTAEIKKQSLQDAANWFKEELYELDGKPYLS